MTHTVTIEQTTHHILRVKAEQLPEIVRCCRSLDARITEIDDVQVDCGCEGCDRPLQFLPEPGDTSVVGEAHDGGEGVYLCDDCLRTCIDEARLKAKER